MKKFIFLLFVCVAAIHQMIAQPVKIIYKESQEDFVNPERGFYIPTGTKAGNFVYLDAEKLKTFRTQPQQLNGANYKVNVSLIYRGYELDNFKHRPLSDSFLMNLQKDFDAVRSAGLKMIIRFAYTNATHGGDCKDEDKICPPYGDAPRSIVLKHVQQLKPLFQKNADVIAVVQQGFIGIWGENYFTDYFGCAADDGEGRILDSSWLHRNQFLKALLDAVPTDRMVQVRTPQIKQRFLYGPRALLTSKPLLLTGAYNKTVMARIGFHNDCFLASTDDYGTFYDYGNDVNKRDTANTRLRKYFEADSRYVAVGGETCDDTFSPQNDCAPVGHAEQEMAAMHYSYLNAAYNNQVNNDWDSLGCMKSIKQKLGYRLLLKNASFPKAAVKGKDFIVQVQLKNLGYASPFNPRPVQLVLRNAATGKLFVFTFNTQIQKWFPGNIQLKQTFHLPATVIPGEYELLLNLPDGYKTLQGNPAYSIRLANEDVWEETTGFNKLQHTLQVR
jgi:Domain of unknown function (DUF4832)/Domain of unknown function (DUF4874)